jgi:hypothetical protein
VTRSRNHCCHGNAGLNSLCTVVELLLSTDRNVKCLILSDFNEVWSSSKVPVEVPRINFHGNPSSTSHADTWADGRTDRKLIGAF